MFGLNFWIFLGTFLVAIYFYLKRKYTFWSSLGLNGPKPVIGLGTFHQNFFKSVQEVALNNSRQYGKCYGAYFGTRPILVVSDPQLVKDMMIKDFNVFVDRDDFVTGDQLNDRSLFGLKGDEWKNMRSIISPTFSSGKMKSMHPMIIDCVKTLEAELEANVKNGKHELELKKMMSNLTMDVIASCAFGTKLDIYGPKTNDFLTNAQKIVEPSIRVMFVFLLITIYPKIVNWISLPVNDPGASKFFRSAIQSIITRRKAENVRHKDYLQLVLNAHNKTIDNTTDDQDIDSDKNEQIFGDTNSMNSIKTTKTKIDISEDDVLATSFLFFVAGYETTGSLLTFLFYSLAMDEKCQQKLYEEVSRFDGNYNYETIVKMPYLEACVAETLRLYNPLAFVERIAAEDYKLGLTGITIPKHTIVDIDIQSIHHNPEYYPNPDQWDPERFMPENRDKLVPYTYMPFGMGPRNCVGMRFALMEAKTAIAYLVNKFKFVKTPATPVSIKPKLMQFLLSCGPITTRIELR